LSPEELRQTAATLLANDLEAFTREAWPVVETESFIAAPYWTAICEHLMAVTVGKMRRLLINCPPRHGKSTLVSVLWPVGMGSRWWPNQVDLLLFQ
jgi:hypothetical protein